MTNQNAQIIKLNYASEAAFETATSTVTGDELPIMAVITTNPQKFGVKTSGTPDLYTYHQNQAAAVAALTSQVNTNTTAISTLAGQIAESDATGAVRYFGAVVAPHFGPIMPPSDYGEGEMVPQLFSRATADLTAYHIRELYIRTDIVELIRLDESPTMVDVIEDGSGVIVDILRYGSTSLGSRSISGSSPGTHWIKADGTDEVLAYVVTDYEGLQQADETGFPVSIGIDTSAFSVSVDVLGDPDGDITRGEFMGWDFVLDNQVAGTSVASIEYLLKLGSVDLKGAASAPTITTVLDVTTPKRIRTKVRVTYIGLTLESGDVYKHNFRTEVFGESDLNGPFGDSRSVESMTVQIAHGDFPSVAYFNFWAMAMPDSAAITEFSQLLAHGKRTPPYFGAD